MLEERNAPSEEGVNDVMIGRALLAENEIQVVELATGTRGRRRLLPLRRPRALFPRRPGRLLPCAPKGTAGRLCRSHGARPAGRGHNPRTALLQALCARASRRAGARGGDVYPRKKADPEHGCDRDLRGGDWPAEPARADHGQCRGSQDAAGADHPGRPGRPPWRSSLRKVGAFGPDFSRPPCHGRAVTEYARQWSG
jgi:hypothetical protein